MVKLILPKTYKIQPVVEQNISKVRIPDYTIQIIPGSPMMRKPTHVVAPRPPYDLLPICKEILPPVWFDKAEEILWQPEREATVEPILDDLQCPTCKHRGPMQGFEVEVPSLIGYPDVVVQCPNCYNVLWVLLPSHVLEEIRGLIQRGNPEPDRLTRLKEIYYKLTGRNADDENKQS